MRMLLVVLGSAGLALSAQIGFAANGDHPYLQPRSYDVGKPYDDGSSRGATTAPREDSMGHPYEYRDEYRDRDRGYGHDRMRSREERRWREQPGIDVFFPPYRDIGNQKGG